MNSEKKITLDHDDEFFRRIIKKKTFQNEVENIRNEFDLKPEKIVSEVNIDFWKKDKKNKNKLDKIHNLIILLIKKFEIKVSYYKKIELYIFTNYFDYFFEEVPNYFACDIELVDPKNIVGGLQKLWDKNDKKYIRLYLDSRTSKGNLVGFINKRWPEISSKLNKSKSNKYVRRVTNKHIDRDKLVTNLYRQSKPDLYAKLLELNNNRSDGLTTKSYKDSLVSKIMGYLGQPVTADNIRKIVYRSKY